MPSETWKHYNLGEDEHAVNMSGPAGYPATLPGWYKWTNHQGTAEEEIVSVRQSVVAYVGKGGAHVQAGDYGVHFDGNGTIAFALDASAIAFTYDANTMRGRYLVRVAVPRQGIEVRVTSTDPQSPLHRIRIVRVADEVADGTQPLLVDVGGTDASLAANPFHEDLLEALRGARLLRFCGWARIDSSDYHDNNFEAAWSRRTTIDSPTQAGERGVAVEYMVALANVLNASAWFCMPRSSAMAGEPMSYPNRPGVADEADLQAYAGYVHAHLDPHLTAFVEYRTDAVSNAEAPQTHAIESLEIFRAWTTAFGADARRRAQLGTRLVRVTAAGPWLAGTLNRFGSDINNVDAVALRASFGELCPYGTKSLYNQCVEFHDRERGAEFYASWTVEQLLDKVEESALYAEMTLNAEVQQLHQRGLRLISDLGGPRIMAADYGARATLHQTRQCEQCLRKRRGNKFGTAEFVALSVASGHGGYVVAEQWRQLLGYQGINQAARAFVVTDEQGNPSYWKHVGSDVSACIALCDTSAVCAGFAHQRTMEWSCGVTYHDDCPGATEGFNGGGQCYDRGGDCVAPGTCYFFNNRTYSEWSTREVEADEHGLQLRDMYWKGVGSPGSAPHLMGDVEAAEACSCQTFYRGDAKVLGETSPASWTLDLLSSNRSQYELAAALEQQLEGKLLEANAHPRMGEIFLDFLDRWRRLGGSLFVAQPLYRPPVLCETGGKQCGHEALMLDPDDVNSSKLRAITSYNQGRRSQLPNNAVEARAKGLDSFLPACSPLCVWGTCVRGTCSCYLGVEGDACDQITGVGQPNACTDGSAPLGMNVAGISDWSRQWVYVDAFKSARGWCHILYGEYNCRDDIEPPLEISPSNGGYPVRVAPGHRACAMMLRDLETHYISGVYTILYEGDGTIELGLDTDYVRRIRPGLIEVDVTLSTDVNNGIYLCIVRQNPEDPIRRIRVMTPGYVASGALVNAEPEFHPAFLHSLRRFKYLRFMDWAAANDEAASVVDWEDRAKEGDQATKHSYAVGPGVPHESMIRLSNTLGASPWLTIPHNASNDYCTQLAHLLSDTLRPDLEVVVSLSNEMWHSGFVGGQFAELMGYTTGLGRYCWYVGRTKEIAQLMRPVLESSGTRTVKFVVESQASHVEVTQTVLDCLAGSTAIDAIGLAPYFDGYDPQLPHLQAVLASYDLAVNATLAEVASHHELVTASGYPVVLYEAGPDGKGNATAQDLSIAAHRDPAMKELIMRYYEGMKKIGVELLMHFSSVSVPSIYGNFGTIEATDQDPATAPKQQGLYEFIDEGAACDVDAMRDDVCADPSACSGRGHCLAPRLRTWGERDSEECSCFFANSGVDCSIFTPVQYKQCGYKCTFDQGVCAVSGVYGPNEYWSCTQCHPQHFGATCSRFRCEGDCNGHGHCLDANVCSCLRGYAGQDCAHDCGCSGHGQCRSDGTCICDVGWRPRSDNQPGCEWDCDTVDTIGCIGPGQKACAACTHGTCVDGTCRCWAGYTGEACTDVTSRPNLQSTFGINLAAPGGTNWVFVDLMKESRDWTSINDPDRFAGQFSYQDGENSLIFTNRQYQWDNGMRVNLSSNGYPLELEEGQSLIALVARDVCKHTIDGRFVILYDGEGEIDLGMDAKPVAFQSGRIDFDFTPSCDPACWFDKAEWRPYCSDNGIALSIRRTNTANPLRNIKLIAPGFLATHEHLPFHPSFLRQLTRFSTLRFMDWAHTNSVPAATKRSLHNVAALRFNITALRGPNPSCSRVGDFFLFHDGSPVPIASANDAHTGAQLPNVIDGSEWSSECPAGVQGLGSFLFTLDAPSSVDAYAWRKANEEAENDPMRWTVEGLVNGEWVIFEDCTAFDQEVSSQRRRAALEGMLTSANLQFVGQTREIGSDFPFQATTGPLEWSGRVTMAQRSMAKDGVAIEYMVLLANQVGAAPWFCVHHLASDDYVRKMAELVRDTLRPDVKIYIEHSNEVWNAMFPQGEYARRIGIQQGLHQTGGTVNDCAQFAPREFCASIRYHSKRSLEIFAIWADVFGAEARQTRLKFVLATHPGYAGTDYHTEQITYMNAHQTVDLFGVTAYMAPDSIDGSYVQYSAEQIHSLVKSRASAVTQRTKVIADVATSYGVATAVYEGGPGLVEDGVIGGAQPTGAVTENLIAANRHPGMADVLDAFFDEFESSGGGVLGNADQPFMYFAGPSAAYSRYGSWGMQEFTDQPIEQAPKYRSVASRISQHAEASGATPATGACVTAERLRSSSPLEDLFDATGAYTQRFSGPPAVTSPLLGDSLVSGQRYAATWSADPRRTNQTERVSVELWQGSDCDDSGLVEVLAAATRNTGSLSFTLNASMSGGGGFFLRISALSRASINYSDPFTVVAELDAPPAFGLYIERDVDLLSAYHRDCKGEQGWAVVPHFKVESCVFSSAEGCRSYRTARVGHGPPSRWNNWGEWNDIATNSDGTPLGVLHGWGKPVTDCTLHIVGVRATMQLEGLTRGFDATASNAVAKVISDEAQVPSDSVQLVNVRTVNGFATYYVSDCRRVNCPGVGRRRRRLKAVEGATAVEFDVSIVSNDNAVANVLTLFSDLGSGEALGHGSNVTLSADHFAGRLAGELSAGYGEEIGIAVRALNLSTAEMPVDDTAGFAVDVNDDTAWPQGLHLAGSNARIAFGPGPMCTLRYKIDGTGKPYISSSCEIHINKTGVITNSG